MEKIKNPRIIGQINTNDEKLNYNIVDFTKEDIIRSNCDLSKIDYKVPLDEDARRHGHNEPLDYSFLSIKYGDIQSGQKYYLNKFPKLTDELAMLMSRYNFGDLKYKTKKQIKNDAKKYKKKHKKLPETHIPLNERENPYILYFD